MREVFKLASFFSPLGRDERGTILVQFTISLIAILGFIGLALDGARVFLLHNDLQDLADAAARAGAASLDGTANALNQRRCSCQKSFSELFEPYLRSLIAQFRPLL